MPNEETIEALRREIHRISDKLTIECQRHHATKLQLRAAETRIEALSGIVMDASAIKLLPLGELVIKPLPDDMRPSNGFIEFTKTLLDEIAMQYNGVSPREIERSKAIRQQVIDDYNKGQQANPF
jgi:hypothetical protein